MDSEPVGVSKTKILSNTLLWGFVVWLFGYILGIIFFALVPKNMIGWFVSPLAIIFTLWVLFKKIERESFEYVGLGIVWAVMAIILDYIFLVKLLSATDYYKFDIYLYYALTFILPIAVGWYKKSKSNTQGTI